MTETQSIKLKLIDPSPFNPRKTLGDLSGLKATMEEHGLLTPLLIRPKGKRFEVVNGHCRRGAAGELGWKEVDAIVRELSDEEALVIMLVDNGSRVDVPPLEEAEAFHRLVEEHCLSVEDVALKVGKGKGHVYGRLKLCGLCDEAKALITGGELSLSAALILARLEDPEEQAQVLHVLDKWGEKITPDDVRDELNRVQRVLKDAPFDREDAHLVAAAGSCLACPKRTGAQAALFEEADSGKDRCTDAGCWARKVAAHGEELLTAARMKGLEVLEGEAAAKVFPKGTTRIAAGWVDLDAPGQMLGVDGKKKLKTLLGKDVEKVVAVDNEGRGRELVKKSAALKVLQEKGLVEKPTKAKATTKASARAAAEVDDGLDDAVEVELRRLVVEAAEIGWDHLDILQSLALALIDCCRDGAYDMARARGYEGYRYDDGVTELLRKAVKELSPAAVIPFMAELLFWDGYAQDGEYGVAVLALGAGVDVAAVRARLKAERAAKAEPLTPVKEEAAARRAELKASGRKAPAPPLEEPADDVIEGDAKCRVCGCTEELACGLGCTWVEPDLCSQCEDSAPPESKTAGAGGTKGSELVFDVTAALGHELVREQGWLHYLDKNCSVARSRIVKGGQKKSSGKPEVIVKTGIKRDEGWLYFIGKDGNVYRTSMRRAPKKDTKTKTKTGAVAA